MEPANVKLTTGHDIGLSRSYCKPTKKGILEDFLKAVELLLVYSTNNQMLEKRLKELSDRNGKNEYLIKSKVQEKMTQNVGSHWNCTELRKLYSYGRITWQYVDSDS